MLFLMATILMVQLKSFQRLFLVLLTAPLALIGVAGALLLSRAPMGFVAILGVISLIGMVIRNSVILIAQIDEHIADGEHPWSAVISATEHRLRPILLTAAAAILGMIPIAPTVFWGPMAYAVMGGLVVATLLTLVFLPALYVAWFRIKPPHTKRRAAPTPGDVAFPRRRLPPARREPGTAGASGRLGKVEREAVRLGQRAHHLLGVRRRQRHERRAHLGPAGIAAVVGDQRLERRDHRVGLDRLADGRDAGLQLLGFGRCLPACRRPRGSPWR